MAALKYLRLSIEDGRSKMEDRRWKIEDGRSKMEDRRWKIEDGRSKMEDRRWKIEDGRSKMEERTASRCHPGALKSTVMTCLGAVPSRFRSIP